MKKPIKHLYFEVLEYLSECGIGTEANIKKICAPYAQPPINEINMGDVLNLDIITKRWDGVVYILSLLEEMSYIKQSNKRNQLSELLTNGNGLFASITKEGLDYYYIHVLRKSTIKSLNNQPVYNFITWGIALLAVGTTIYTIAQNTDLNKKMKDLTEEVQLLKSWQHSVAATHKTVDTNKKNHRCFFLPISKL